MKKDIQKCLAIYKQQLQEGFIQTAYVSIIKCISELKRRFPEEYTTTNVGPGYLDYTYLYFVNEYIKEKHLKYALVFNHQYLRFELWLCARVINDQKRYWELLKDSQWNKNKSAMPKYAIIEVILQTEVDFDHKEKMIKKIIHETVMYATKIEQDLRLLP